MAVDSAIIPPCDGSLLADLIRPPHATHTFIHVSAHASANVSTRVHAHVVHTCLRHTSYTHVYTHWLVYQTSSILYALREVSYKRLLTHRGFTSAPLADGLLVTIMNVVTTFMTMITIIYRCRDDYYKYCND